MTAEQIAAGLTKAQRDIVLHEAPDVFVCGYGWLGKYRRLCQMGLLKRTSFRIHMMGKPHHSASYKHTPLGLEVRRILQETPDD